MGTPPPNKYRDSASAAGPGNRKPIIAEFPIRRIPVFGNDCSRLSCGPERFCTSQARRSIMCTFREDAVIASLAEDKEGTAIEAATTGPEGMIGVGAIAGDNKAVFRHMVQVPGGGQRVAFDTFQKMMIEFPIFRGKLIAFSRAFQIQAMQSAACSAKHSVRERLARWRLMYHDRVAGDELSLTQEFLAEKLSVSRVAVNRIVNAFECEGLLTGARGVITVVSVQALREISCDCYFAVRGHYDRLLPGSFTK